MNTADLKVLRRFRSADFLSHIGLIFYAAFLEGSAYPFSSETLDFARCLASIANDLSNV